MNNGSVKTGGIAVGVILLVVGLLGGFGITKAMDNNNNSTATSQTKAADLRANLVTLGVAHMQLTDQAIDAALDGSADANATAAALYQNGNDLGSAVGSVYGKSAQTTFDSVWKLHLDQFVKYSVASKSGDSAGKSAALSAIDAGYTKPLAQYLAKANPNLPEATLESALREHVDMTAQMIDSHVAGNYSQEASELKMADTHIEGIMSTLAGAIVKQYPAKFNG